MEYYTYILQSFKNNHYYISLCENIDKRLIQYNSGKVFSTKNNKPYKLIYFEKFDSRQSAYNREL